MKYRKHKIKEIAEPARVRGRPIQLSTPRGRLPLRQKAIRMQCPRKSYLITRGQCEARQARNYPDCAWCKKKARKHDRKTEKRVYADLKTNNLLDAAIQYAGLGYPVLPCIPNGKAPLTKHGFKDATTNIEKIKSWWTKWPNANIAIALTDQLVVDVDGRNNPWQTGKNFASGARCFTPRGGTHFYYNRPSTATWKNTAAALAPKVDTRTRGGYVLVPPSVVNGKFYRWAPGMELSAALANPPEWLANLLNNGIIGADSSEYGECRIPRLPMFF